MNATTLTPELIGAVAAAIVLVLGTLTTSIVTIIKLFNVGTQIADNTERTNAVHAQTIAINAQTAALNAKTDVVVAATAQPPTPPDKVIVP